MKASFALMFIADTRKRLWVPLYNAKCYSSVGCYASITDDFVLKTVQLKIYTGFIHVRLSCETIMRNWDDEFANMAHVPGSDKLQAYWAAEGSAYRQQLNSFENVPYGSESRESIDLVLPVGTPKGLVVFVHGGYWMRTSPSDWTQLAEGARAQGWAVAMPGYTLAPDASIAHITQQVQQAIVVASEAVSGPIILTGHSAGGHLVARAMCTDSDLPQSIIERIKHCMPISGVFDLRPLLWTAMNDVLHLDDAQAIAASPVLCRPHSQSRCTFWVGADERPEFVRQNRLMAIMWDGLSAQVTQFEDPGKHHFSVIEGLRDPASDLTTALLKID